MSASQVSKSKGNLCQVWNSFANILQVCLFCRDRRRQNATRTEVTGADGDAQSQLPKVLEECSHWREKCAQLCDVFLRNVPPFAVLPCDSLYIHTTTTRPRMPAEGAHRSFLATSSRATSSRVSSCIRLVFNTIEYDGIPPSWSEAGPTWFSVLGCLGEFQAGHTGRGTTKWLTWLRRKTRR